MSDWQSRVLEQRGWLQSVIGKYLSEPEAVEDVLQETLQVAIRGEARSGEIEEFRHWLGGVAKNKSRQWLRDEGRARKKVKRFRDELAGRSGPPGAPPTPLQFLIRSERSAEIRAAFDGLGAASAEILRLKYEARLSYAQIGARLGVGHDAVTNRLRSARNELRRLLRRTAEELNEPDR